MGNHIEPRSSYIVREKQVKLLTSGDSDEYQRSAEQPPELEAAVVHPDDDDDDDASRAKYTLYLSCVFPLICIERSQFYQLSIYYDQIERKIGGKKRRELMIITRCRY